MTIRRRTLGLLAAPLFLVAGTAVAASPAVTWTGNLRSSEGFGEIAVTVKLNAGGATGQITVAAPARCALALQQTAPGASTYSLTSVYGGMFCDRLDTGQATIHEHGVLDMKSSRSPRYTGNLKKAG